MDAENRARIINELTHALKQRINVMGGRNLDLWINHVLKHGLKGFKDFTDEELLRECQIFQINSKE